MTIQRPCAALCCALLLLGCSATDNGMSCVGEVKTLAGQSVGRSSAVIVDRFRAFTVITPDARIESGPLYSADSVRFIPSAVTKEGFMAQRLSANTFCIIDPHKNEYVTYYCQ